nr:MAG TPA: hypothetical protein [Bacteriophage sp.]
MHFYLHYLSTFSIVLIIYPLLLISIEIFSSKVFSLKL